MVRCRPLSAERSWRFRRAGALVSIILCLAIVQPALGEGQLATLREDVRTANAGDPSPPESRDSHPYESPDPLSSVDEQTKSNFVLGGLCLGAFAATSPLWVPHAMLDDSFSVPRSFASFPYDDVPGYMTSHGLEDTRPWACQFSTDYTTAFDKLDSVGGHLVFSTASRFGADVSARNFQERLPGDQHDSLWLGDANLVFCFARNEHMQWRTGLGVNWLGDTQQTDVGFNFTYGFDWFPRKPWVASTEIDWGTLGRSGFFHFRGTVGVLINRFEAYTGYEYYDFDCVHTNSLIGGIRVWF